MVAGSILGRCVPWPNGGNRPERFRLSMTSQLWDVKPQTFLGRDWLTAGAGHQYCSTAWWIVFNYIVLLNHFRFVSVSCCLFVCMFFQWCLLELRHLVLLDFRCLMLAQFASMYSTVTAFISCFWYTSRVVRGKMSIFFCLNACDSSREPLQDM